MNPTKIVSFIFSLLLAGGCILRAGEACFSQDGKRVYLKTFEPGLAKIEEIGLDDGSHRFHAFPQSPGPGEINQLECLSDGALLLLCDNAIWKWTADHQKLTKIQAAPKGTSFIEMALSRPDHGLAVWCWAQTPGSETRAGRLMFARSPAAKLTPVRMRRVLNVTGLCFHGKNELLFGTEGDLWNGTIEEDEASLSLTAERFAPLSDRETSNGTPSQTGVSRVAVSAGKIYTHVSRMGGSGWGNVIRLSLPSDCEPAPEIKDMRRQFQIYSKALNSVEVLEENGSLSFLCASQDGKRVFFTNRIGQDRTCFLIENDGAAGPVKVLPAQP